MPYSNAQLLGVLGEIKGGGTFVSSGVQSFIFPGLQINGLDEISFPVNISQIRKMIKVAHKAPFGKGSETVLDTSVRSAWEIDAEKISFNNPRWKQFIGKIVAQIKPDLGIEDHQVSAKLYKLLAYEKGDFFVAHRDSEKENGMFGTLIIGLPAKHSGGELLVRFDGQEEIIDFSGPSSQYQIPYAAFYADCEHEIKPVTSGYRVCLVYNLVQSKKEEKIKVEPLKDHVKRLAALLKSGEEDTSPKIILLGHQYTPSNFTLESLKLNDRTKAEALTRAAEKAEYYIKFGLVTSYQTGALEIDYRPPSRYGRKRHYYDDYEDDENLENGRMGEVYDEYVEINHWMEGGIPPLRQHIEFKEDDLIAAVTLNEGEPIEKNAEGYTGNAGMEMEYWYHYGAAILWSQKHQYDLLIQLEPDNQLEWIGYYNRHWNTLQDQDMEVAKKLIAGGFSENTLGKSTDFSPLADWLINLNDEKYLSQKAATSLTDHFTHIPVESWMRLFEAYPSNCFENIFTSAGSKATALSTNHLLAIINKLSGQNNPVLKKFVSQQIIQLPAYLKGLKLSAESEKKTAGDILQNLLKIDNREAGNNAEWLNEIMGAFTKDMPREYVNDVLIKTILHYPEKTNLAKQIMMICKKDLEQRVANKPKPPANWAKPVPNSNFHKSEWNLLADFLKSPTQQVFNYQALKAKRADMEYAIRSVTIDLKMETIRKGSPHTLRLTKTYDAYKRELAKWEKDVELLEEVEGWYL